MLAARVRSAPVDDDETLRTMRWCAAGGSASIHTAVGVAAALRERLRQARQCMGCAHREVHARRRAALGAATPPHCAVLAAAAAHRCVAPVAAMAPHGRATRPASTPPGWGSSAEEATGDARAKRIERWSAKAPAVSSVNLSRASSYKPSSTNPVAAASAASSSALARVLGGGWPRRRRCWRLIRGGERVRVNRRPVVFVVPRRRVVDPPRAALLPQ